MAVITTPTSASGQVNLTGTGQDDTINAHDYANVRQTHVYAGNGDDVINMYFGDGDRYRSDWIHQHREYQGHHVRGGNGHDVFNFDSLSSVTGTVIGRIEDFDLSRDVIQIEGASISASDLKQGYGQTSGYSWKVVEWNGDHNDLNSSPQQWLLIDTGTGWVFYSLEGARVDVTGNGAANSGEQEGHFFTVAPPNFAAMTSVGYVDPVNVVPETNNSTDYQPSNGGILINDVDVDGSDVAAVIQGTDGNDVIAAGLNDDSVQAGGGHDRVWGGSGNDTLSGGSGDDTIQGGTGSDVLIGGNGSDTFVGKSNQGPDTVQDFVLGEDIVVLQYTSSDGSISEISFSTFQEAQQAGINVADVNGGVLVSWDIDGNAPNLFLAGLSSSDLPEPPPTGDNLINDTVGRSTLTGTEAADTFVMLADAEKDDIQGFDVTSDVIDISAWGASSLDDLWVNQDGANQIIVVGDERIELRSFLAIP